MSKFAKFDSAGFAVAFYDSSVHGNTIPSDGVEISDEQWLEFLEYCGMRKWIDGQIVAYEPPAPEPIIPDRVTRRQFRLQLIDAGLLEQVEEWIATQNARTQAAYADSGTFLRTDEMLQQGFTGLGFSEEQIDAFFTSAASL